jgi:hypothetical protein
MKSFYEWLNLREMFGKPIPPPPPTPYDPNRNKPKIAVTPDASQEPIKELPIKIGKSPNDVNIYQLADAFGFRGKVEKATNKEILIKYPKNIYGGESELKYYIHRDGQPAIDTAHYNPKWGTDQASRRKVMDPDDTNTLLTHLKKYVVKPQ